MIASVDDLELQLSEPTDRVVETLSKLKGDLLVLGVGGKMGPSLARMAKRALQCAGKEARVIGVSRFGSNELKASLQEHGVETIQCDLLDEEAVSELPDAPNVVFMAGMKFGASGREALTWAMNAYLPAVVCQRYRSSRIVAFSTGNVYGLVPVAGGGSVETDSLQPVGEYAMSCVGRERIFEYFSSRDKIPVCLLRINYASELRYGVLLDMAQKVWGGERVDLSMGHFNTIWLGDANALALCALGQVASPPEVLNITGAETLSVQEVAEQFGRLFGKKPEFSGKPAETALLSNAAKAHQMFGPPKVSTGQITEWVAQWVRAGGPVLNKPTHFESRDGRF
jgi:nucleoside-diphosphate-sugar epimerase